MFFVALLLLCRIRQVDIPHLQQRPIEHPVHTEEAVCHQCKGPLQKPQEDLPSYRVRPQDSSAIPSHKQTLGQAANPGPA